MTITLPPAYRNDCAIRFDKILNSMGDISFKSMIDIGCANGYFIARFLESGGDSSVGIDNDVNKISEAKSYGINVFQNVSNFNNDFFNFGLFLDLYFHSNDSDEYLDWLKEHCKTIFVSPSGDGERNNMRLAEVLMQKFNKIELIYKTDYSNRMIFKCE